MPSTRGTSNRSISYRSSAGRAAQHVYSPFLPVYAVDMWSGPLLSGIVAERIGLASMLTVTSVMSPGAALVSLLVSQRR